MTFKKLVSIGFLLLFALALLSVDCYIIRAVLAGTLHPVFIGPAFLLFLCAVLRLLRFKEAIFFRARSVETKEPPAAEAEDLTPQAIEIIANYERQIKELRAFQRSLKSKKKNSGVYKGHKVTRKEIHDAIGECESARAGWQKFLADGAIHHSTSTVAEAKVVKL